MEQKQEQTAGKDAKVQVLHWVREGAIVLAILCGMAWVASRFFHPGRVEFTDNATVRQDILPLDARVQGRVVRVGFDEFQRVRMGDTLVVIEDAEYRLRLAQAEADLANARIATSVMEAAVELARLDLSYTVVVAPCDGVVGRRNLQVGQLVRPGQTLVSIVDDSRKWVVANYRETQLRRIKIGMPVDIEADALPDAELKGRVCAISEATGSQFSILPQDNSAGNFVKVEQLVPVRICLDSGNAAEDVRRLRAGMNVETRARY